MFRTLLKNSKISSLVLLHALLCTACSNLPFVPQHTAPSRIFLTDYSTAWTAAIDAASALGANAIKTPNRDTGTIETNWFDDTERYHFLNVFTDEDFFLRSRYRLEIQVRQGKKNDQSAVMIRILRIQQMEKTFLSGWEDVESDGVDESTALYRIGRLIAIQQYNEEADKRQKAQDDSVD